MGSVKLETPSQNRGVHEYEKYNLSDLWCIKDLIINRSEVDEGYKSQLFASSNPYMASDIPNWRELICCIYADLENLVNNCGLDTDEMLVIDKLMMGYDEFDIEDLYLAQQYGIVSGLFDSACEKIKEENDLRRYEYFEKNGIKVYYKICKCCGEKKLVSKFSPDVRNSDGLHSFCKKCRKK